MTIDRTYPILECNG